MMNVEEELTQQQVNSTFGNSPNPFDSPSGDGATTGDSQPHTSYGSAAWDNLDLSSNGLDIFEERSSTLEKKLKDLYRPDGEEDSQDIADSLLTKRNNSGGAGRVSLKKSKKMKSSSPGSDSDDDLFATTNDAHQTVISSSSIKARSSLLDSDDEA